MSSLVKNYYTNIDRDTPKVIDSNTLAEKKISALREKMASPDPDGFFSGLVAETYEGDVLYGEEGFPEGEEPGEEAGFQEGLAFGEIEDGISGEGNVIKAGAGPDQQALLAQIHEQADEILNAAREEAEAIIAEATRKGNEQAISIRRQAQEKGYEEGYAKASTEYDAKFAQLEEERVQLTSFYEQQLAEIEPQLVDAITAVYEHVFHTDLSSSREILLRLVFDAMQGATGNRNFLIHVSKEDAPYVIQNKQLLMDAATLPDSVVEVLEDLTLGRGDCMIETDNGIVDCGLGTQLSELTQKLRLLSFEKR